MCLEPASMTALAIQSGATLLQYQMQKTAADGQERMIQDGYAREAQQTQRQYQDQTAQAMEDTSQRHKEMLIEEGRLKAIGAESGLQGASNDRITQEALNNGATDVAMIEANRVRQAEMAHSQGVSRQSQAQVQLAGVKRPSALGVGLQIAGAGWDLYAKEQAKKPQQNPGGK